MLEAKDGEKRVRAYINLKHNGVVYKCLDPECQHPEVILVAGARRLRIPHFRHKVKSACSCSDGETEWHLEWKSHFERVEIDMGIDDVTGEHNRADAVTGEHITIEFQHSPIELKEQENRERFYTSTGGLIWVVDARGKRACARLRKAIKEGELAERSNPVIQGNLVCDFPDEVFPPMWVNRSVGVIFDYGVDDGLIFLMPGRHNNSAICRKFTKEECVDKLLHSPEEFLAKVHKVDVAMIHGLPNSLQISFENQPVNLRKIIEPNIFRDQFGFVWRYERDGFKLTNERIGNQMPMPAIGYMARRRRRF